MPGTLASLDVLVEKSVLRHATSVLICRQDQWRGTYSYRCGHCGRGLLGEKPHVGQHCKVCGSKVVQVPEARQFFRTSVAGMGSRHDGRASRVVVNGAKASKRVAVSQTSAEPGSSGPADLMKK